MNKTERIQIRVTTKQKEEIEDFCKARDLSVSRFCRDAIFEKMRKMNGNYNDTVIKELKEKINGIREHIEERNTEYQKLEEKQKQIESELNVSEQVSIVENIIKEHRKKTTYKTQKTPIYLAEILKKSKLPRDTVIAILKYNTKFKRVGIKGGYDLNEQE